MPADDALIQLTIKSVPATTRDTMNRLARKRGQTLGVWLAETVARADREQTPEQLVPPHRFEPLHRPPAVILPDSPGLPITPEQLVLLMAAAKDSPLMSTVNGLVRSYVRDIKGRLSPRP